MKTVKTIIRHLLMSAAVLFTATSVLHAATTDALPQAHAPRCAKPVFYAQTTNHKKEVEICIVTPSVSYSFGKIGTKSKEMNLTVPAGSTTYAYQNNQVISIQDFTVRNGDTSYQVSAGSNDSGEPFASLYVYKGTPETGKLLAEIKLDPDTVANNISHSLAEEGVIQADSL
ncbi:MULTISPECIES: hypothetical protein [unclassified Citrobacter]|uniref:hypothetical protein n=1 Tax=unclassified Citrobacter TaxID=2644389 RepID=UPI002032A62C|nr:MULTISPECIES: hypothetical protein [unclassified Citrobacter]MDM3227393.1 hypothetical protein [Citrobacter sp. Cf087]UQX58789.1 hypothetical protein M4I31_20675 [Citrobacter sp. XT1-2-2]